MKKLLSLLLGLSLLCSTALAATDGGFAGAFARMGAGARAKAMGNAFTGLAEGPAALYFNAGALPFHTHLEFSASTSRMALDRSLDYLAFSAPLHPKAGQGRPPLNAGVGVGWLHAGVGNIDSRDFDGNPLEKIDQSSNLFLFGFGLQPHPRVGLGVTAKVIYETFGKIGNGGRSVNGNGFGADLAAFINPWDKLTIGGQWRNIGAKTTWSTTDYWEQGSSKADKWPSQFRVGAAYQRSGITGALDLEGSEHNDTRLHAGLEGAMDITDRQSAAARIGYDNGAPTFGIGLGFAIWKVNSTLDFTYVLEDVAPDNSLLVSWGVKF
jgi:hypothetical protein